MAFGPSWRTAVALSMATLAHLATADICSVIKQQGTEIEKPLTLAYNAELTKYWSAACGDLRPSCIAAPSSALEMSAIVKQLHNFDDLFAVKSGGHMPNNGFASVQDGLLISTKNLDQVIYNPEDQTAIIGPGLSWEDAQKGLDGTGRTIVGGRLGGVGVGGYMLGGGLSFLSSQYGWAANNVVNFEVVLANGTVVNANAKENTDLFAALKGGGNNFGIVTAYTLQTHPQDHKVWGGNYVFTADQTPQVLSAVRDFTENYPDDKAAIIVTVEKGLLIHTWIMFLFYDGPEPPEGVFTNFTAIPHTSTTKTWDSYYDLLKHNDLFILHGQRYTIATETTPLPNKTVGAEVMQGYYDHWLDVAKSVLDVTGVIASLAFQPMPRTITSKAKALGGDLLDFPTDQDYIIIELDYSYAFAIDDNKIDAAVQRLYGGFDNIISANIDKGLLPDVYRPLFMNDAYFRQDYWGRIRTKEQALQTRLKYDPDGFFQKRTSGGFRLR
ncbi:FAD-binding oxidoreductase [Aspergillus clavatus NRRL 1]|uniref:FAD dependent oxidoreductase, putative n=1 Tax=Aspergillus clavatus (strain ATCC 1007 / CBS 513.65 / DSM 816 / NCTC 3887 / NRRL 1 / QM 1276 / 107) TaxID=344612 RepID=A1CG85_ASPCL|nr:FAD dependent oxidoreductase, putative [Aspergillus clavatus NRRL 1]EAW10965.1 FAD dependent oxidoreductase, putative [Aspergillus clavatus NRRL 1]